MSQHHILNWNLKSWNFYAVAWLRWFRCPTVSALPKVMIGKDLQRVCCSIAVVIELPNLSGAIVTFSGRHIGHFCVVSSVQTLSCWLVNKLATLKKRNTNTVTWHLNAEKQKQTSGTSVSIHVCPSVSSTEQLIILTGASSALGSNTSAHDSSRRSCPFLLRAKTWREREKRAKMYRRSYFFTTQSLFTWLIAIVGWHGYWPKLYGWSSFRCRLSRHSFFPKASLITWEKVPLFLQTKNNLTLDNKS